MRETMLTEGDDDDGSEDAEAATHCRECSRH